MASVCAGTLALMDAGVPVKTPVAGISVGLVTEFGDDRQLKRYELLTDIIGSEDHFGDMDFKLCGTDAGVTGFQLDLKLLALVTKSWPKRSSARKKRGPEFSTSCAARWTSRGRNYRNTRRALKPSN